MKGATESRRGALVRRQVVSQNGLQYVAYERTYNGLPVQGGDAVVVTDGSGAVLGNYVAQEQALSVGTTPTVSAAAAARTARKQLATVRSTGTPVLKVVAQGGAGRAQARGGELLPAQCTGSCPLDPACVSDFATLRAPV